MAEPIIIYLFISRSRTEEERGGQRERGKGRERETERVHATRRYTAEGIALRSYGAFARF